MCRKLLPLILILGLGLPGSAADKDDLPLAKQISWEVGVFEQSRDFKLVKRTVSNAETVSWLLEINGEAEVNRLVYYGGSGRYSAVFCDDDGAVRRAMIAP